MKNDLTPMMQKRLDEWRNKTGTKATEAPKRSFGRAVGKDHGDDFSDIKPTDQQIAQKLQNNPIFKVQQ